MSVLRRARARMRIKLRNRPPVSEAGPEAVRRTGYALNRFAVLVRRVSRRLAPYLTALLSVPIVLASQLIALLTRIAAWVARRVDALSAALTPQLALGLVAIGCCLALAASQFVAYSGVAVDAPGYGGQIGRVAPAPIAGAKDAGSAHAYVMLPLAAVALGLVVATLRGRWRLGRLVAVCGLIAVVITLLIDLPQGIDAGTTGLSYGGSEARLLEGFWAQLAAAGALLFSGALLGVFAHRAQGRPERRSLLSRRAGRRAPARWTPRRAA